MSVGPESISAVQYTVIRVRKFDLKFEIHNGKKNSWMIFWCEYTHKRICFRMSFSALSRFFLRDGAGQAVKIWYRPIPRPVLDFDRLSRPVPSLGKILSLSCCPFVSGQ